MLCFIPILAYVATTVAASIPAQNNADQIQLPLVIWHGLGDDFQRDGLQELVELAKAANPGTYVHLIHLADTGSADRQQTFFGNVTEQMEYVCEQLAADPILSTATAVNALGFSQGGQFLRGYIERCNNPPVHNLVTYGSQHNGISEFQSCKFGDWFCNSAEALLKSGTWADFVQSHIVPAQYFRDPEQLDQYLEHSNFLADINNERAIKNHLYKKHLITLNKFVMYMFENDTVAVPKESAHFAEVNATEGSVTPLKDRLIYKEDWLGLKNLDDQGKLKFRTVPGEHMRLEDEQLKDMFKEFFAPIQAVIVPHSPGLVIQRPVV